MQAVGCHSKNIRKWTVHESASWGDALMLRFELRVFDHLELWGLLRTIVNVQDCSCCLFGFAMYRYIVLCLPVWKHHMSWTQVLHHPLSSGFMALSCAKLSQSVVVATECLVGLALFICNWWTPFIFVSAKSAKDLQLGHVIICVANPCFICAAASSERTCVCMKRRNMWQYFHHVCCIMLKGSTSKTH